MLSAFLVVGAVYNLLTYSRRQLTVQFISH